MHEGPLRLFYQSRGPTNGEIADRPPRGQGEGVQGLNLQDNDVHARNGEPHPAIPDLSLIFMPALP